MCFYIIVPLVTVTGPSMVMDDLKVTDNNTASYNCCVTDEDVLTVDNIDFTIR